MRNENCIVVFAEFSQSGRLGGLGLFGLIKGGGRGLDGCLVTGWSCGSGPSGLLSFVLSNGAQSPNGFSLVRLFVCLFARPTGRRQDF